MRTVCSVYASMDEYCAPAALRHGISKNEQPVNAYMVIAYFLSRRDNEIRIRVHTVYDLVDLVLSSGGSGMTVLIERAVGENCHSTTSRRHLLCRLRYEREWTTVNSS